ncbi:MAG: NADH-quinone oxidoreductase subunit L [Deltaproteobacteria bacterium]|nr:NADH-quinone oxidoreductase subunit L [Deltaproteobacteria bacterium]
MTGAALWEPPFLAAGGATLLPLAACAVILLGLRRRPRLSAGVSIAAVAASFACSVFLLASYADPDRPLRYALRWLGSGQVSVTFGFLLDPLSVLMLVLVAGISLLVQVYSLGYMAGDPGFGRYYGYLSLFAWAMTSLAVSSNLLQLYVFWELVGLASYLLIGFWYEKFSATQAGKKAFVMTRTGDVGFFLGVLLLALHLGNVGIPELGGARTSELLPPDLLTLSALLLFCGVVGKSAQFPLLTWLPDAMEGPTPVSALLHSATMVAAGVYLLARLFPFFRLSPTALTVFLSVGTLSMLLASTMALVSRDLKRIWAYSTISQLGLMIMGLAAGGYFAGVFHLTTHAAFKALLFLCSGVFIHRFQTNDVFELGRLRDRSLALPAAALAVAAAALAGLPPLSGFFSKDAVLATLAALPNPAWFLAGLLGTFLTAYYAFRAVFLLYCPKGGEKTAAGPGHGGPGGEGRWLRASMSGPLVVLAAGTLLLGFFEEPLREILLGAGARGAEAVPHAPWLPYAAAAAGLAGLGLAWFEFARRGAEQKGFAERVPAVAKLFAERWYLDRFYVRFVERVVDGGLSYLSAQNERRVIDGTIDGLSGGIVSAGGAFAAWGRVMIQYRLLVTFGVLVLLSLWYFFR